MFFTIPTETSDNPHDSQDIDQFLSARLIPASRMAELLEKEEEENEDETTAININVSAESWRFFAYLMFWIMCIFAVILTQTLVVPYLADGPKHENDTCGPFSRNDTDFGVSPGEGFDFTTQSHLRHLFGFNNICANWDYSPSRELVAMFYPLFEYPLVMYLCLDYLATSIANKRGQISPWVWKLSQIIFPICIFLCAQFRMIFVCLAYEDVRQHTAGFLGLQIALILVALHNAIFVWDSKIAYKRLGGPENGLKRTRIGIVAYMIGLIAISIAKVCATTYVVFFGHGAAWTLEPVGSVVAGQVVDWLWMIFNAIIPMFLAFFRARYEAPLNIAISQKAIYVTNAEGTFLCF